MLEPVGGVAAGADAADRIAGERVDRGLPELVAAAAAAAQQADVAAREHVVAGRCLELVVLLDRVDRDQADDRDGGRDGEAGDREPARNQQRLHEAVERHSGRERERDERERDHQHPVALAAGRRRGRGVEQGVVGLGDRDQDRPEGDPERQGWRAAASAAGRPRAGPRRRSPPQRCHRESRSSRARAGPAEAQRPRPRARGPRRRSRRTR